MPGNGVNTAKEAKLRSIDRQYRPKLCEVFLGEIGPDDEGRVDFDPEVLQDFTACWLFLDGGALADVLEISVAEELETNEDPFEANVRHSSSRSGFSAMVSLRP